MSKFRNLARAASVGCAVAIGLVGATAAPAADTTWQEVKEAGVLRCGAAQAAPYVMRDARSGEYSGYFTEVCRRFAEHLGVDAEFVDTNWDNIVAGVQSDRWDLAMALNETPERAEAVAFSEPVSTYQVSFLYNKNNPKLDTPVDSLSEIDRDNITIAVMSGTVQDKTVSAETENARIMRLPGMDETRLAVMSRRADVLADAHVTNLLFHYANPDWAAIYQPEPPLAPQGVAFGLSHSTPEADLEELNEFIRGLKEEGVIEQLINEAAEAAAEDVN